MTHGFIELPGMLDGLEKIGVRKGDCLIVHSSFKSLGLTYASPRDVIYTFLEALGEEGTLMMPTFTYSFAGIYHSEPFNHARTPGRNNGVLTETLRNFPGALRSAHPTYSVAAFGKHARLITHGKETASMLGIGSSFHEAYQLGAKILLLGVGNTSNSMLHYAEVLAGLPYGDIPVRAFWGKTALVEKNGGALEVALPVEYPGCSLNFAVVDDYLEQKGILKRGPVLQAGSILMEAQAMVTAVVERLKVKPDWLLCDSFACEPCNLRRKRLHATGLI
jgi:aminoglycoside 3-N-acetyltransferase